MKKRITGKNNYNKQKAINIILLAFIGIPEELKKQAILIITIIVLYVFLKKIKNKNKIF